MMSQIFSFIVGLAAILVIFALVGVLADVVAPVVIHLFPKLEAKLEKFYESLPMSGDDWDE